MQGYVQTAKAGAKSYLLVPTTARMPEKIYQVPRKLLIAAGGCVFRAVDESF